MTDATTWTVELRIPEDAARSADVWLSADCQQGWCITCGAGLLEGEVDQSDAKRVYPEDEAAGFVLTCVAQPCSDLVLEVEQYDELLRHRADHDRLPGRSKLD